MKSRKAESVTHISWYSFPVHQWHPHSLVYHHRTCPLKYTASCLYIQFHCSCILKYNNTNKKKTLDISLTSTMESHPIACCYLFFLLDAWGNTSSFSVLRCTTSLFYVCLPMGWRKPYYNFKFLFILS